MCGYTIFELSYESPSPQEPHCIILRVQDNKAIKILQYSVDENAKESFDKQNLITTQMQIHESIASVYECVQRKRYIYIKMDYFPEKSLNILYAQERKNKKPFNELSILNWSLCVAHGLELFHSKNLILRNIEPGNLLVCKNGDLKISSFMMAKINEGSQTCNWGTLMYRAPEQEEAYDEKVDMWSFACAIIYEGITKKFPVFIGV